MCTIDCIERLLVDLRTLGKIEEGKKINTKEKYISSDDTTFLQPLWRWYRGDSRMAMGNKIQDTLSCTTDVIKKAIADINDKNNSPKSIYLDVSPAVFLYDLREVLILANKGLKNLRDTYVQDDTMSSKLELQIQTINRQLDSINNTVQVKKERRDSV
jgi:hypothetical protein